MNSVSDKFNQLASGSIRPLDWELRISWTKDRSLTLGWFTLDQSVLNGPDLLGDSSENPIQPWQAYDYLKYRDRVIEMTVERSVDFPENVQSAVADFTLDNHDGHFSYTNPNSSIANYILPMRPVMGYLGFTGGGITPVFTGFTEAIPDYDGLHEQTATITAFDPISWLADQTLPEMLMLVNKRTDEVLSEVLTLLGINSTAYSFDEGLNTIPFVFYESGKDVGNIFKELMQAENGFLWIDESGVIRFEPRTATFVKPSVLVIDENDLISITPKRTDDIYNYVSIEADVRVLKSKKAVFEAENSNGYDQEDPADDSYRISANSTLEFWANLDDPCYTMTDPTFNGSTTDSYFTALQLDGTAVTSGMSASGELFGDSYKLTIHNNNNFAVSVDMVVLFGEPAEVLGNSPTIKYEDSVASSVEAFGQKKLEITDNDCFGSYQNVKNLSDFVLDNYSGYSLTIDVEVKGNPALQLQDVVTITNTDYDGTWVVTRTKHTLSSSGLATELTLHRGGAFNPFILNQSILNGTDVLV